MKNHKLYSLLIILVCFDFSTRCYGQSTVTIKNLVAGSLSSSISSSEKYKITDLTITGELNGSDIKLIRNMAGQNNGISTSGKLKNLDISGCKIVSGGDYYLAISSTSFLYAANDTLGKRMFLECSNLRKIILPSSIKCIDELAFYNCKSLQSISIPESVTSIRGEAFENCDSITTLTVPKNVTDIAIGAFGSCFSLISIKVDPNNQYYSSVNGILFNKDKSEIVQVPGGSPMTNYNISREIKNIKADAFDGVLSLVSLTVDNDNENYSAENGILFNKDKTVLIKMPASSPYTEYAIPQTVNVISFNAFRYSKNLESVSLPDNLRTLETGAFANCTSLLSIDIPNSVTKINLYAFQDCWNLSSVKLPSNITVINNAVFARCYKLKSIIIPVSVNMIDVNAFYQCTSLDSIKIPFNVTELGASSFINCTSLKSVYIPGNVTKIGTDSFSGCSSLKDIWNYSKEPQAIIPSVFSKVDKAACTLHVPISCIDKYKAANVWKDFHNIKEFVATGINSIKANNSSYEQSRYSIDGILLNAPTKGINIVKMSNGQTKKIFVK